MKLFKRLILSNCIGNCIIGENEVVLCIVEHFSNIMNELLFGP